MLEKIEGII